MAPDLASTAPEIMAVAFVVESSLPVLSEWRQILIDYVGTMMRRLTDTCTTRTLRIAFISYGSADTMPSPLLCNRFFTDYPQVVKIMKEEPASLGLGQTNARADGGMAALEGLVAAIELFDALKPPTAAEVIANSKSAINHIIHIAASPPDNSVNPTWNNLPELDNTTWDILPEELKKRNIHFNSINLRKNLSRFSQLHGSAKASVPWFAVRQTHSVYLAEFPTGPQQKGPSKRPNDVVERGSDLKRARISRPVSPPKGPIPSSSSATDGSQTSLPSRSSSISTNPSSVNSTPFKMSLPPQQQHLMAERVQSAEIQLLKLKKVIEDARKNGNKEQAESQFQDYAKKRESLARFKQALNSYNQQGNQPTQSRDNGSVQPSMQSFTSTQQLDINRSPLNHFPVSHQSPNSTSALPTQTTVLHVLPSALQVGTSLSSNGPKQTLGLEKLPSQLSSGHALDSSGQIPSTPFVLGAIPSFPPQGSTSTADISFQLQKLLEQHRPRPPLQANSAQGEGSGILPTYGMQSSIPQAAPKQSNTNLVSAWSGSLKWSGQNASGKKEVQTFVTAMAQNLLACHAGTWPGTLTLVPTRESAVSTNDFQAWITLHKPILCPFQPQQHHVADAQLNHQHYLSLAGLLVARNLYATAAWTTPSGSQTNNVLVFPANNGKALVGAFFPLTGIPEMPRTFAAFTNPTDTNPAMNKFPMNIPPQLFAQLQHMNPEKRNAVLSQMRQRQNLPSVTRKAAGINQFDNRTPDHLAMMMPGLPNHTAAPVMNHEALQLFITQNTDGNRG